LTHLYVIDIGLMDMRKSSRFIAMCCELRSLSGWGGILRRFFNINKTSKWGNLAAFFMLAFYFATILSLTEYMIYISIGRIIMKRIALLISLTAALTISGCGLANSATPTSKPASAPPATIATPEPSNTQIEYAFTRAGQKPEKMLIDVIASAKETLDIAIYSLTYPDIIAAIKDAHNRGVAVRVITDKQQSEGKSQTEALKILGSAGIPMMANTHSGLMHLKVTIADKKVVTTGSFNYSKAASTTNDEVLMVLRDETIANAFTDQFETMWNDTKRFAPIDKKIAQ